MRELNVGMLGFGFMGRAHSYGYINLPLVYDPVPVRSRLHSVCTSSRDTAERARALLSFEVACTDYREITESPDIDIVHVCTPNKYHKEALLSAMAHGKHIYCDKPLVVDAAEADEVARALPAYEGIAQMVFHNRFFPATLEAKRLVEEGFLGRPLSLRAGYLHSGNVDPEAPLKWKLSRDMGGGVIADLGSHVLDLIVHLVGDFEAIWCATGIAYEDRPAADGSGRRLPVEAEDAAFMVVRVGGGGLGTIEASKIATGALDELRFEIHGENGAIRFNLMRPNWLEIYESSKAKGRLGWQVLDTVQSYPKPAASFPSSKASIGWLRAHMASLHNFLDAVARGVPAEPGLQQGIYIQRVMEAAKISDKRGGWVDLRQSRFERPRS
jgi:predicted dehydrogenase